MNRIRTILVSAGLIFVGLFILAVDYNFYEIDYKSVLEYLFLFWGVVLVLTSMNDNSRGLLFLGSLIFMAGIVLLVINEFEILNPLKIVLPSVLLSFGAAFFLLFVQNHKEKVFLFTSIILFGISILLIVLLKDHQLYNIANRVSFLILEFWPILLTLIGLGVMLNRNYR